MVVSTIMVTVYTVMINVQNGEILSIKNQMESTEDAELLAELQAQLDSYGELIEGTDKTYE